MMETWVGPSFFVPLERPVCETKIGYLMDAFNRSGRSAVPGGHLFFYVAGAGNGMCLSKRLRKKLSIAVSWCVISGDHGERSIASMHEYRSRSF